MSYDEMMNIKEHELRNLGVTLGGSGKIFREIQELKNRPKILNELKMVIAVSKTPFKI